MNAARLTRRWQEAAGDPVRMVEALVDEINDPVSPSRTGKRLNAARLIRRWQEAAGDPARMAKALVDELDPPATGAITRDPRQDRDASGRLGPKPRLGGAVRSDAAIASSSELWRKVWIGVGVQVLIVSAMTAILFQVLRWVAAMAGDCHGRAS